jgi:hypothetical protein
MVNHARQHHAARRAYFSFSRGALILIHKWSGEIFCKTSPFGADILSLRDLCIRVSAARGNASTVLSTSAVRDRAAVTRRIEPGHQKKAKKEKDFFFFLAL